MFKYLFFVIFAGCQTTAPVPAPEHWVGDSTKTDISRKGGTERISCYDPGFDDMICVDGQQYLKLLKACGLR